MVSWELPPDRLPANLRYFSLFLFSFGQTVDNFIQRPLMTQNIGTVCVPWMSNGLLCQRGAVNNSIFLDLANLKMFDSVKDLIFKRWYVIPFGQLKRGQAKIYITIENLHYSCFPKSHCSLDIGKISQEFINFTF